MTLQILPWKNSSIIAKPVHKALLSYTPEFIVGVTENDPELSDTYKWSEVYGVPLNRTANVVIVEVRKTRNAERSFAAVLVLADSRADLNGIVKRTLEVSKVSFAPTDKAVQATGGMESGGMSPIGLPDTWPLLVDSRIISVHDLSIGSGIRASKLVVNGKIFLETPNTTVIEGLGIVS